MNRSALDFRHFVDHLRRQGDLVDVHTEVDANLEIGAITRRVYERRAPAPLFHNIRDSLPGARVLGAPAGLRADRARAHSRLALHFGLPEHSGPRDIVAMLRRDARGTDRAAPAGARAGAGKRLARRAGGPDPLPGPLAP